MKTVTVLTTALLAAMSVAQVAGSAPKPVPVPRAEVVFVAPENFTDARDSYTGSDAGREDILAQLREYFQEEAQRFLPEGYKVFVSVTDVDLAGEFEPWRGPRWDDVRVVKDIYPPRIALSFRLTDPAGQVMKEGKRDLRDMTFLMKISTTFQSDPLRHDKTLIDDWFRDEFRDLRRK